MQLEIADNLREMLDGLFQDEIDIFFDSVYTNMLDAAFMMIKKHGRYSIYLTNLIYKIKWFFISLFILLNTNSYFCL